MSESGSGTLSVLDLFCGLKGWSRPWFDAGHDVYTLDLDSQFNPTYCQRAEDFLPMSGAFDVILASPPCEEFSRWAMRGMSRHLRANPPPLPSTRLVEATKRIIAMAQPKFWVVENVHGSSQFITPVLGHYRGRYAGRYLWGNFPSLAMLPPAPKGLAKGDAVNGLRPKSSYSSSAKVQRAEIPAALANAMMEAMTR